MRGLGWGRALFLAVAALQIVVVLGFAGSRELALRRGAEIVLETVPVDPRDLFRGDYVVLRYAVSTVRCGGVPPGTTIYVPLEKVGDVYRSRETLYFTTLEEARGVSDVFLRGRVVRTTTRPEGLPACEVEYGIESYFVPEGTGREIERLGGQLKVRVSLDGRGGAVIKGLILPEATPTPVP